jgi:hypothetical protein
MYDLSFSALDMLFPIQGTALLQDKGGVFWKAMFLCGELLSTKNAFH